MCSVLYLTTNSAKQVTKASRVSSAAFVTDRPRDARAGAWVNPGSSASSSVSMLSWKRSRAPFRCGE